MRPMGSEYPERGMGARTVNEVAVHEARFRGAGRHQCRCNMQRMM
jgi:hypothetical protein